MQLCTGASSTGAGGLGGLSPPRHPPTPHRGSNAPPLPGHAARWGPLSFPTTLLHIPYGEALPLPTPGREAPPSSPALPSAPASKAPHPSPFKFQMGRLAGGGYPVPAPLPLNLKTLRPWLCRQLPIRISQSADVINMASSVNIPEQHGGGVKLEKTPCRGKMEQMEDPL